KGCGELSGENFEELVYEGYGSAGVAVLCDILTENRNRTAGEVRKIFEVHGGNLGSTGCVAWMFERKGLFLIPADAIEEDELFEVALEVGADDVSANGDVFEVTCSIDAFQQVSEEFEKRNIPTNLSELSRIPDTTVDLGVEDGKKVLKLMEALEDHDDVQSVTANFNIPDEIMAEVIAE
ncbi:MAG TPA: YebC/PmpR family DNA-binding transcriptional regulator, partial [Planctomycetaceae bacterium]|nr:YebC/PmpR family DNA-binding transcriptional regulator [Planctomycetaceae bacterium]